MITYLAIFFLAFWAGFSVRRGSICLVRATHEIVERKPAKTMLFVMEAMTVALSITIPAMIFFPDHVSLAASYDITFYLVIGAALYGLGASINGACALGTLNQLMNGKIEYLATILGLAAGFMVFLHLDLIPTIQKLKSAGYADFNVLLFLPLMIIVWGVALFQTTKFMKQSDEKKLKKFQQYLTSPVARDFIGVSIFGLCGGLLYLILGRSWDYTKFIMDVEEHLHEGALPDISVLPALITTLAIVSGMTIATVLSKNFKFHPGTFKAFAERFLAGSLMGFAVGFIPGGNDTIILHGIPGIAFHAPVALTIMMMSIAVVVLAKKSATQIHKA